MSDLAYHLMTAVKACQDYADQPERLAVWRNSARLLAGALIEPGCQPASPA